MVMDVVVLDREADGRRRRLRDRETTLEIEQACGLSSA